VPIRLCLDPRCRNPATYRGRCADHARSWDKAAKRVGYHVYRSKRWEMLRRRVLFEQPLCECGAIAVDVDHITPLEQGGRPYERKNCQGLCKRCHGQKTKAEQGGARC
jgi:5-methylcytosine-specific restriction protein A